MPRFFAGPKIKRTQAAELIDGVRTMLANREPAEKIEHYLEIDFAIKPLQQCDGDPKLHEIDHCPKCQQRWGVVGKKVVIT